MRAKPGPVLAALILMFILQGTLQRAFITDFWSKNYARGHGIVKGLAGDQLLAVLAGFRPLIAGILWVRANSFFESGNYDAILPMIRLVTWLDPQQIDVYATGMWHIGYNFTDEQQRSDRRYIPSALALGKEGAKNNPDTYEMFFETGWFWYHKIDDDYPKAVKWFELAQQHPDMQEARKNLLGMAYQRNGQIQEGLDFYLKLLAESEETYKRDKSAYGNFQQKETLENNVDTMLVRMAQRGYFAKEQGHYDEGEYDTKPPFDVGFSARVTVEDSKVLMVQGTWNVLPVGTRIRCILRDKQFPNSIPGGLDWDYKDDVALDPPKDLTFMQEQLFVRNRWFERRVDMSKDPTMYPCTSDKYVVEFFYDPRSAAPHIQDKFGWNGEGMTDSNFLREDIRAQHRVIFASLELTRDQILRRGEWIDKVPVVQTSNFKSSARGTVKSNIIQIPNLRAGN